MSILSLWIQLASRARVRRPPTITPALRLITHRSSAFPDPAFFSFPTESELHPSRQGTERKGLSTQSSLGTPLNLCGLLDHHRCFDLLRLDHPAPTQRLSSCSSSRAVLGRFACLTTTQRTRQSRGHLFAYLFLRSQLVHSHGPAVVPPGATIAVIRPGLC